MALTVDCANLGLSAALGALLDPLLGVLPAVLREASWPP
jgi:hypothetical protein